MTGVSIPETFNVASYFVDRNIEEGREGQVAILYEDQEITYGEVYRQVNRVGNALRHLGVEMEERVLLLLLDCPQFVYSFFGAIKTGAVPIPTNTLLKPQDYEYILNDSRAVAAIVSGELLPQIEPVISRARFLKDVIVVGQPASPAQIAFEEWVRGESQELTPEETSKDDVAFWLYSSGTTGQPKGVVHLHHDMVYCTETYAKGILKIEERDRTFSIAKLFFAYGLGNALYFPFGVGASTVLYPGRFEPERVFALIQKYKPTLFYGVPTAYAALLSVEGAEKRYDLSSLRLCVSAGEALPPALYERWRERFGLEILDGIGTTEVLHIFISNRPGRVKPGSSGEVVPGYEVKLVDEAGKEVGVGEVGNLMVKGDSIAPFYWNKHEKSKQTFLGEWMLTGDKYYRDGEGYYYHAGRADDMLKVGGHWFSPVEVEAAIVEHPAVLECAVVGATDQEGLVKPKAFVVLKPGYRPSSELARAIQDFVKQAIAPYKYPRWVEFVAELPKTATGKIQRFRLRQGPDALKA